MGFDEKSTKLIKSYLTDRKIFTKANNQLSTQFKIQSHGVPQGSIMGPLLFLIYINDIDKAVPSADDILLFADDTCVHISGINAQEVEIKANRALDEINNWFNSNHLTVNPKKTKFINYFSKSEKLNLSFNNTLIKQIGNKFPDKTFRYLGFHLDENLTFDDHVKQVVKKVGQGNFFISRVKNMVPLQTRKNLYHSYCGSHLNYGSLILAYTSKKNQNNLLKAQKKAIRNVNLKKHNYPTEELFINNKILRLDKLYYLTKLKFVIDARDEILPNKLQIHFNKYGYDSRRHNAIDFLVNRENVNNFIRYSLPIFYNELDIDERKTYSKIMYTDHYKNELFGESHFNNSDIQYEQFDPEIDELPFLT